MKITTAVADPSISPSDMRKQAKLVDAAQQFEASMLQELLKPLQHGQSSWGDDEKSGDSSFDTLSSFGSEVVAKAISKAGGFGIAKQVIAQVSIEHQHLSDAQSAGTKVSAGDADKLK